MYCNGPGTEEDLILVVSAQPPVTNQRVEVQITLLSDPLSSKNTLKIRRAFTINE